MKSYWDNLLQKAKDALDKSINGVSVLYTLVQLNKFVEDRGRKSEFPTIRLYRDWLVHTDLDWNKALVDFFEGLDQTFDDIGNGVGIEVATQRIQAPLKFHKLFEELSSLNIKLNTDKQALFVKHIVDELIDAPLRRAGRHVKEFRFTYEESRKEARNSYVCHMQIKHVSDRWFDGPEVHFETLSDD